RRGPTVTGSTPGRRCARPAGARGWTSYLPCLLLLVRLRVAQDARCSLLRGDDLDLDSLRFSHSLQRSQLRRDDLVPDAPDDGTSRDDLVGVARHDHVTAVGRALDHRHVRGGLRPGQQVEDRLQREHHDYRLYVGPGDEFPEDQCPQAGADGSCQQHWLPSQCGSGPGGGWRWGRAHSVPSLSVFHQMRPAMRLAYSPTACDTRPPSGMIVLGRSAWIASAVTAGRVSLTYRMGPSLALAPTMASGAESHASMR